jgi:hypothetical protein
MEPRVVVEGGGPTAWKTGQEMKQPRRGRIRRRRVRMNVGTMTGGSWTTCGQGGEAMRARRAVGVGRTRCRMRSGGRTTMDGAAVHGGA